MFLIIRATVRITFFNTIRAGLNQKEFNGTYAYSGGSLILFDLFYGT